MQTRHLCASFHFIFRDKVIAAAGKHTLHECAPSSWQTCNKGRIFHQSGSMNLVLYNKNQTFLAVSFWMDLRPCAASVWLVIKQERGCVCKKARHGWLSPRQWETQEQPECVSAVMCYTPSLALCHQPSVCLRLPSPLHSINSSFLLIFVLSSFSLSSSIIFNVLWLYWSSPN